MAARMYRMVSLSRKHVHVHLLLHAIYTVQQQHAEPSCGLQELTMGYHTAMHLHMSALCLHAWK